MIDPLINRLIDSGPLGILCAVLLVACVGAGLVIRSLFGMYVTSQEKRIEQGLAAQEVTRDQINVITSLRDVVIEARRR